ncbi:phage head completion protein [Azospirillum argentinense]
MATIDMSGLMLDPLLAGTPFTVIRRAETVNEFGETVIGTETIGPVYGSISPTGDNSLVRQDAFQAGAKTIKVITAFRLRGPSKDETGSYQPDLILWAGTHYIVRDLKDWTAFGGGFVEADCSSIDFVDSPPQEAEA